jgi:hypothetical protein
MYIELNVVVECDEGDHITYDTESEMARQEFITKELAADGSDTTACCRL